MTKSLTPQELVILTEALNRFHQEIVEEFESTGDAAGTLLFFKVQKDGLSIKIAAKTDLVNEELKQYLEMLLDNFFHIFLGIENVNDFFQLQINTTAKPNTYNLANIQVPDELHETFITRLQYKCSIIPDKFTLKRKLAELIKNKDAANIIQLLLSSPYTDRKSHERIISVYKEVINGFDPSIPEDALQLLFVYETIFKWRQDISQDKELTKEMKPFFRNMHSMLESLSCEVSNPIFPAIIKRLSEIVGLERICDMWATHDLQRLEYQTSLIDMPKLLSIIKSRDEQTREKIISQLLLSAIKKGNLNLIGDIHAHFPNIYDHVKNNPAASQHTAFQAYEYLLSIEDPVFKKYATLQMKQIMAGFGYLEHDAGLLALAARDVFTPGKRDRDTIIINNDANEIDALFDLLSQAPSPIRQRFLISGGHWTSYDVLVDAEGKLSILMLDSLGGATTANSEMLNEVKKNIVESISKKDRFNDWNVFIGMEKRQHDYVSCQIFSLDDISHLYSVDDYLNPAIYPGGLFDYLQQNIIQSLEIDGINIHFSKLPLHLIRNMHSASLLEKMQEERRGESQLSHRPDDTPAKFHEEKQGFFKVQVKEGKERELNLRLDNKLKKLQTRCLQLLKNNDFESLKSKMRAHTFEGMQDRILRKSLKPM